MAHRYCVVREKESLQLPQNRILSDKQSLVVTRKDYLKQFRVV
jgi:hypothetical protein